MQRTESWFTASDFSPEGRTLTIDHVELREIAPQKMKFVVYFKNESKSLVLNEVNTKTIEKNTGEKDIERWGGYSITLYSTTIMVKGQITPCIRIKFLVNRLAAKE
jgi:hypothetical protein